MLNLLNICSYIGRGKGLPSNFKYNDETINVLGNSDIDEEGFINISEKIEVKTNSEDIFNDICYTEENDIIFPELYRNKLQLKCVQGIFKKNVLAYSNKIIFIRVNPQLYNSTFLYHLLNSEKYKRRLEEEVYKPSKGYEGVFQIRLENLRNFEIPFIPIEQQKEIIKKEQMKLDKINRLKEEINELYDL